MSTPALRGEPSSNSSLARFAATGLLYYYLTSLIVVAGVYFGYTCGKLCTEHPGSAERHSLLDCFAAWDGEWYVGIAERGYSYDPQHMSSVAFFPAYPLLGGLVQRATGLPVRAALLIVSHAALAAAFVALAAYVRARWPQADEGLTHGVLLAAGLFPTTFFWRMTYSESLLLLVAILAMFGMLRGWRLVWIALLVGLGTATRPVGIALLAPFLLHLAESSPSWRRFVLRAVVYVPLGVWGLAAYMAYQAHAFGTPLAFATAQAQWSERSLTWGQWAGGLATFEPLWRVYDPESVCYWSRVPPRDVALLNLKFANAPYFVLAAALVAYGAAMRWINRKEVALAVLLLLIPYLVQSGRMCTSSHARFAGVAFPVYLVLGHLSHRAPAPVTALVAAGSAVLLAIYAAQFANWYWFY